MHALSTSCGIFELIANTLRDQLLQVGFHTHVEGSPDRGDSWATVNGDIPGGSVALICRSEVIELRVFNRSTYQRKSDSRNPYDHPFRVHNIELADPDAFQQITKIICDLHPNKQWLRMSGIFGMGLYLPFLGEPPL